MQYIVLTDRYHWGGVGKNPCAWTVLAAFARPLDAQNWASEQRRIERATLPLRHRAAFIVRATDLDVPVGGTITDQEVHAGTSEQG